MAVVMLGQTPEPTPSGSRSQLKFYESAIGTGPHLGYG